MKFNDSKLGGAPVIGVSGRIDATAAPLFDSHCSQYVAEGHKILIVDLSEVDYLSSAGLRSLVTLSKKLRPVKGKLVIVGVHGTVKEIFDIAGFSDLFPMCDTIREAASHVL
jgi:anti-anti-sigma factor